VADPGIFRIGHQAWQRANITAAAAFLREILTREPDNARVAALYEGLLDVVDPARRVLRQQRALASATAVGKQIRRHTERRADRDRRQKDLRVPAELDRRSGSDRRTGGERRKS
jgi:hypothetical protein